MVVLVCLMWETIRTRGDGSTFDTAGMEVDDAPSDDGEDGDAWFDEESHDEMLSDDMERPE